MGSILLTGGTGTLGRHVHRMLTSQNQDVRILSRTAHTPSANPPSDSDARTSWVVGDLRKNEGVREAVAGVSTIVHCATGRDDVASARRLLHAAKGAGNPHFVFISIVGVDRIPLFYYQNKVEIEKMVDASGLDWTVLRATQFHNLVYSLVSAQKRLPAVLVPDCSFQPIDVREVATRLTELALGEPAGRVPDIGGPEIKSTADFARAYQRSTGKRGAVVKFRLPGKTFTSLAAGNNLTPENRYGTVTFDEFLAEQLSVHR